LPTSRNAPDHRVPRLNATPAVLSDMNGVLAWIGLATGVRNSRVRGQVPVAVRNLIKPFRRCLRPRHTVKRPVEIFGDVSDMRRGQHILQGPEGMIGRQGLSVEDVEGRACNRAGCQGLDESAIIYKERAEVLISHDVGS